VTKRGECREGEEELKRILTPRSPPPLSSLMTMRAVYSRSLAQVTIFLSSKVPRLRNDELGITLSKSSMKVNEVYAE